MQNHRIYGTKQPQYRQICAGFRLRYINIICSMSYPSERYRKRMNPVHSKPFRMGAKYHSDILYYQRSENRFFASGSALQRKYRKEKPHSTVLQPDTEIRTIILQKITSNVPHRNKQCAAD